MELSAATLEHLQDEAYASLCREALQERLAALNQEKAALAETRPPFGGLLARKETREAFDRSLRSAQDSEAALQERLSRIDGIVDWLRPLIRTHVSAYLADVSAHYCALLQIAARLDDWHHAFQAFPELFTAFARDLREVRTLASTPGATATTYARELAVLRGSAERLSLHRHEISVVEQAIAELITLGEASDIRLPVLPELDRVGWVGRLAVLPTPQVLAETARVETEVRNFLAQGCAEVEARLQAGRDIAANLEENALEQYWAQLRAHARAHYVEAREVDDVLDMLTQRYIDADIKSRQNAIAIDPFVVAR